MRIRVQGPAGIVEVPVPEGCSPGMQFQFQVTAAPPPPPPRPTQAAPRQEPTALPPAAMNSLRPRSSGGGGGFFGFGAKAPKKLADGLDTSLPKHLELQGLEIGRLGQLVRQLAGEAKYEEALEVAQQRLTLTEKAYGKEHILTATCLNDVATFLQAYSRFQEAEQMFERASKLQRKLLGDTHPHSIATLNNLVSLYGAMGDTGKKEAMEFLVQALQATAAKQG